jgi:hypothetical protein
LKRVTALSLSHYPYLDHPLPEEGGRRGQGGEERTIKGVAPREVVLWGLPKVRSKVRGGARGWEWLGNFTFTVAVPFQTTQIFPIEARKVGEEEGEEGVGGERSFEGVRLEVLSNQGHPDYTCLYRVGVYGEGVEGGREEGRVAGRLRRVLTEWFEMGKDMIMDVKEWVDGVFEEARERERWAAEGEEDGEGEEEEGPGGNVAVEPLNGSL